MSFRHLISRGLTRLVGIEHLSKAQQMLLFGAPAGGGGGGKPPDKPKPKLKAKPKIGAWEPIPHPRGGRPGRRRRKPDGTYEYDYDEPAKGYAAEAVEAKRRAAEVEGPQLPEGRQKRAIEWKIGSVKYRKPEDRDRLIAELETELGAKKAAKGVMKHLKVEFIEHQERGEITISRMEFGEETTRRATVPAHGVWEISVEYDPAIPGHQLLAHVENGRVTTIHHQKEITHADYEAAKKGHCDVCKTNRQRKHVYILERDADAKHIIVGGECAKKFKGHDLMKDVREFDQMAKILGALMGTIDDLAPEGGEGGGGSKVLDQVYALGAVKVVLDKTGAYEKAGVTRDSVFELMRALASDPPKDLKKKHAEAMEAVSKEMDGFRDWIKETITEAKARNRFNDLFESLNAAVVERDYFDPRDIGRVAWAWSAFKDYQYKKKEASQKKPVVAYKPPVAKGKMHDLPGTWTISRCYLQESEWGSYFSTTAINEETGEKIWFKISNTDKWESHQEKTGGESLHRGAFADDIEGQKFALRGKAKDVGRKGDVMFMSHISPILTGKKAAKEKAAQKAESAKRKTVFNTWKDRAKAPDFWKTAPIDILNADMSRQAQAKIGKTWNDSLETAIRAGNMEALQTLRDTDYRDERFADLDNALRRYASDVKYRDRFLPSKAEIDKVIANWPEIGEHLSGLLIVKNEVYRKRSEEYEAKRKAIDAAWEEKLKTAAGGRYWDKHKGSHYHTYEGPNYYALQAAAEYGPGEGIDPPPKREPSDPLSLGYNFTEIARASLHRDADKKIPNLPQIPMKSLQAIQRRIGGEAAGLASMVKRYKKDLKIRTSGSGHGREYGFEDGLTEIEREFDSIVSPGGEGSISRLVKNVGNAIEYAEKNLKEAQGSSRAETDVGKAKIEFATARLQSMKTIKTHVDRHLVNRHLVKLTKSFRWLCAAGEQLIKSANAISAQYEKLATGRATMKKSYNDLISTGEALIKGKAAQGQTSLGLRSGEGSRGGKVIGHTRSGKPIYEGHGKAEQKKRGKEGADPEDYRNDHLVDYHRRMAKKHRRYSQNDQLDGPSKSHHSRSADLHEQAAGHHENAKRGKHGYTDQGAIFRTKSAEKATSEAVSDQPPTEPEGHEGILPSAHQASYHAQMRRYHTRMAEHHAFAKDKPEGQIPEKASARKERSQKRGEAEAHHTNAAAFHQEAERAHDRVSAAARKKEVMPEAERATIRANRYTAHAHGRKVEKSSKAEDIYKPVGKVPEGWEHPEGQKGTTRAMARTLEAAKQGIDKDSVSDVMGRAMLAYGWVKTNSSGGYTTTDRGLKVLAETKTEKSMQSEPIQGGKDNDMLKALYGMRREVTEWANQFHGSPMYTEALECLRDNMALEARVADMRKNQKSWREIDDMPRSKRAKERERQSKQDAAMDKERETIAARMTKLEVQLVDHRIKEAKDQAKREKDQTMSKSMDDRPMTDGDKAIGALTSSDMDWMTDEGLPFNLRPGKVDGEQMQKSERPLGSDQPAAETVTPGTSSFYLRDDVGTMDQPANGGVANQGQSMYADPGIVVTTLIPEGDDVYGGSRGSK
jgi:hypothetical protein